MNRARIEYEVEGNKRRITFVGDLVVPHADLDHDLAGFTDTAVLLVQVDDAEDADALVAAIEKVDRPKKTKKRITKLPAPGVASQPPADGGAGARAEEVPRPAELPSRCEAPDCVNEGTSQGPEGNYCSMHWNVSASIHQEWHAAFLKTQRQDGARKARGIRKQIEGAA